MMLGEVKVSTAAVRMVRFYPTGFEGGDNFCASVPDHIEDLASALYTRARDFFENLVLRIKKGHGWLKRLTYVVRRGWRVVEIDPPPSRDFAVASRSIPMVVARRALRIIVGPSRTETARRKRRAAVQRLACT